MDWKLEGRMDIVGIGFKKHGGRGGGHLTKNEFWILE